jgi:nucleotide-binding universal stress UspA family protein
LVAVQVDSSSAEALAQAGHLARLAGAELELIHVFETPGYGGPAELIPVHGRVPAELLEPWRSAKAMAAMMNGLLDAGVKVNRGWMLHGVVEDLVLRAVRQGNADLLVIGNHHPSRLERTLSGDVVGTLLHRAPCPVLVVPHS